MAQAARSREERRVALLMLQRLLMEAESSLALGDGGSEAALEQIGEAFELFRSRHESEGEPATPTPERESRRSSVGALASLLAEADELVAKGDPQSVEAALEIVRAALDIARRLDDPSRVSGVRRGRPDRR